MSPLRVVFLGSDPIALPLLDWLAGEGRATARVVAVFTQPDRASGRGQQVRASAIKVWAQAQNLPVYQPEKLTEADEAQLTALAPDVALVMAYGHILRESFIAIPRKATVNLHASLLPKYRGASPIQTAVASGERVLGASLMRIVRALDAGPVADTERFPIGALDTAADAEAKMAAACIPLLARGLPRLAQGTLSFVDQDASQATYCRRLVKEDGDLDFHLPAAVLAARINVMYPWPACTIVIEGQPIKLGQADTAGQSAEALAKADPPGTILGSDDCGLLLATSDGILRLRRLQRPGAKMLGAAEFCAATPSGRGQSPRRDRCLRWSVPPHFASRSGWFSTSRLFSAGVCASSAPCGNGPCFCRCWRWRLRRPGQTGPESVELANLREDVRGLSQKVADLTLRVEQLETEAGALREKAKVAEQGMATVSQLNEAVADLNRSMQSAIGTAKDETLRQVAAQMAKLAQQTNAALNALAKGQATRPPVATVFSDDFPKEGENYTVQKGDTLAVIAKKTGAKVQDIINANKIADPSRIQVGQTLFIPGGK